jgi:AcrR family transcriptional regulator
MGTQTRKAIERKNKELKIIASAEKIIFIENRSDFTMQDIAKDIDMSVGSLYSYFKNKSEIIAAICQKGLDILIEMEEKTNNANQTGYEQFIGTIKTFISFAEKHNKYFFLVEEFFSKYSHDDILSQSVYVKELEAKNKKSSDYLYQAILKGIKDKTINAINDPDKISLTLGLLTKSLLYKILYINYQKRLQKFYKLSAKEIINIYLQLLGLMQTEPQNKGHPQITSRSPLK